MIPLGLSFAKLTFFLLYLQIFRPSTWMRCGIYAGAFLTTALYVSIEVARLALTSPGPGQKFWQKNEKASILVPAVVALVGSAGGVAIDLYIVILPIAGVLQLQLPLRRKIGVSLIFMTGSM